MSFRFRLTVVAGLGLLIVLATAAVTFAHAQYASSTPPANSTIAAAPAAVAITFSEEVSSIKVAVTGPHGSELTTSAAAFDLAHRTNTSVPVRDDGPGKYTVVWHNVSGDDGDPNDGSFLFTVAGSAPAPTVAPAAQGATVPGAAAAKTQVAPASPTCIENGQITPGIADARVDTYCKRQGIREQYKGKINELVFNFDLSIGMGFEASLKDAMGGGGG